MQEHIINQIKVLEERIIELEQQLERLQNADIAKFNRIECREIRVISDDETPLITLNYDEEVESPAIKVHDNSGYPLIYITSYENGGAIAVFPNPGTNPEDEVGIQMYIDEYRSGHISVNNADGESRAILSVEPPYRGAAGRVTVCGAMDNHERVVIGSDPETDNGTIRTYSGIAMETDSLGDESGDLQFIGYPVGSRRHLEYQQLVLARIDEKLQSFTNEDQLRILNIKKEAISRYLSQATEDV